MAARVIGIDIGSSAVRAVEIEMSNPPVVHRMGQVALPPTTMLDGEIIDVAAVSSALQRLWSAVGFTSKHVRVGFASARMIVRVVDDMPRLPADELVPAVRLQLDELVPLPSDSTVFDVKPLASPGEAPDSQVQRLLLAAAHQNALDPVAEAVRRAGLKLDAIDAIPVALARALSRSSEADDADLVVSVGSDTVVVVAAQSGIPVFSRTLTNISGRRMTEQIAARLELEPAEAERRKRWDVEDAGEALAAREAARSGLQELADEIEDSIAYYSAKPSAPRVGRLVLTGGGSQLGELDELLGNRLGIPVVHGDPFEGMRLAATGFEDVDRPYLAPYMGAAVGIALAGGAPKATRFDLTPRTKKVVDAGRNKRALAIAGGALLVVGLGAFYMKGRSAIADEKAERDRVLTQVSETEAQIAALRVVSGGGVGTSVATPESIYASVAEHDVDWLAAADRLDELGTPLGVAITSIQGAALKAEAQPAAPVVRDAQAPALGSPRTQPTVATPRASVGRVAITATAPDLDAIAAWLDAVNGDDRFGSAWVGSIGAEQEPSGVPFTAEVFLAPSNLVQRPGLIDATATQPREAER